MRRPERWALAAWIIAWLNPALAQVNAREPNPAIWLRQVYDLYKREEGSTSLLDQANYGLIVKRASKSLAALFKKNDLCEKKEKGICALDWDFIIDGQDWQLTNIKVGEAVIVGDKATVTASFKNFNEVCVNVYSLVSENGAWKVEDILTKSGTDAPISIAKLLSDYKD